MPTPLYYNTIVDTPCLTNLLLTATQSSVVYVGNNVDGPTPDTWLTEALQNLGTMAKVEGALSPKCVAANPGAAWKCLYVNESLPYITSSLFAVNQMLSVWDSQCQIEGLVTPSILQVACSLKGPGWATVRQCNQCVSLVSSFACHHLLTSSDSRFPLAA